MILCICVYVDLSINGNHHHLKKAKKDQETVLDQEPLKKDQNKRKNVDIEIGYTAGKDLEVEKDQVIVKKDQEDQKNIDE